ncbi:putative porin [Daejeonella oryzae]|uniref:putative porin n=1 Tax=Daejeonella oryzae TaxID=1122943 RepID=UPI000414B078|nr:putative porin [Daejeonella oryzae]
MKNISRLILFLFLAVASIKSFAQEPVSELDSLRKMEESDEDSVVVTAKYIRYTNLQLLKNGTRTNQIDTTLLNFQNYSPLYQPEKPTIGLGSLGISYRDLLFNPSKSIGFNAGFHSLDRYMLRAEDIKYYRARSPYTELYYVNGSLQEQVFKVTHTQNVNSNFNFGANYNRIGSEGFYINQKADHLNAALFAWYESPSRRYNLWSNVVFNTLKAGENGSTINDSIFFRNNQSLRKDAEVVRLSATGVSRPKQTWREQSLFLKQSYNIGRIDSLNANTDSMQILPTQRLSHTLKYSRNRYNFFKNERDVLGAFPSIPLIDSVLTSDSTRLTNLHNEFMYSFYLRGKTIGFLKNEVKLDLGIQHDLYQYEQNDYKLNTFQNVALQAGVGYRFSDRVDIEGNFLQIASGRNAGDFLYEAKTNFLLSKSIGRIVLGAYSQNKSPEEIFERLNYTYHQWDQTFDRTKINNFSFLYENQKGRLSAKAEYFLLNNYLYFEESSPSQQIRPVQLGAAINLLKVSLRKDFKFGKFNLDNFVVYQKSDFQDILRTPEIYTYNSFYYSNRLFKVLYTHLGFDVRYNTRFKAPAYAINAGQFYNYNNPVEYLTNPVVDVWIKATLKRTNLFLKYDYANQNLFSKGYYTVSQYPMQDALLKFGLSWKFYN